MILRLTDVYPKGILEPVREVSSTRRTAPRGRMRPGLDDVVIAGVDEVLLVRVDDDLTVVGSGDRFILIFSITPPS